MTIHAGHPFAEPEESRDPMRRFRGRLGGGVTLWTAGSGDDSRGWAGLTVSSLMVAAGEPPRLVALLDPDADLTQRLEETGRAAVALLSWPDRDLAEMFAGTAPAPGGAFAHGEFTPSAWGPRLVRAATWAGVRHEESRAVGWSQLVTVVVEEHAIGPDDEPLGHRRGRWTR